MIFKKITGENPPKKKQEIHWFPVKVNHVDGYFLGGKSGIWKQARSAKSEHEIFTLYSFEPPNHP